MLTYLGGSANSNIARSYINFIQNGATDKDYMILDDIFRNSGSIGTVLTSNDLRFGNKLLSLQYDRALAIEPEQVWRNLGNNNIDDINTIVDNIVINLNSNSNVGRAEMDATNLSNDLTRVLIYPLEAVVSTYSDAASTVIAKQILTLQLEALNNLDPNDPAVIAMKEYVSGRIANDSGGGGGNDDDDDLTPDQRDYALFLSAFPPGQLPTAAQSAAALELISGNYLLADNQAFLTSYAKFVSSGDSTSANTLTEIAHYFGANSEYNSSISAFDKINLDAESVATAAKVLDFGQMLKTNEADFPGGLFYTNRFLLDTILNNNTGAFNAATERDLTEAFFQVLEETLTNRSSNVTNQEYDAFIMDSIYGFSYRLYSDDTDTSGLIGLVDNISRGFLGSLDKDEIAEININMLQGMLSFYQSQIQQENAKPQPDTSKIGQWQTQISAHQAAITALQGTLS
jgi:hypothetical protein